MAKIITVHGTFAHQTNSTESNELEGAFDLQWWQAGSVFDKQMRDLVKSADGDFEIVPFIWSGDNSETARRKAGSELLDKLKEIENQNDTYCLIGHSHGGAVIAKALMESAAKGISLNGLKKWITVGTPFVDMKRERLLFSRISLIEKAIFVSSLMLLVMFVLAFGSSIIENGIQLEGPNRRIGLLSTIIILIVPFLLIYVVSKLYDRRQHFFYKKRNIRKAEQKFTSSWLSLCHEDDEAVHGLMNLHKFKFNIFHDEFAVPILTFLSIFILPLAYLYVISSPTFMTNFTDFLKDNVYAVEDYEKIEKPVMAARQGMRQLNRKLRSLRARANDPNSTAEQIAQARKEIERLSPQIEAARQQFRKTYPNFSEIARARRFKRRFLEENGQPCNGGSLCREGTSTRLNSTLIFHLVTDEISNAFIDRGLRRTSIGRIINFAAPVLIVTIIFAVLAVGLLLLVQLIAHYFSATLSKWLDHLTWAEIKRSALGNDTKGEIALGAIRHPYWISKSYSFLPQDLGQKITDYSNNVTKESLAKFRNAISELALTEAGENKAGVVSTYLTWRELIHSAYFEVSEFNKIVGHVIGEQDGFKSTELFTNDPDHIRAKQWLEKIKLV